MPLVNITSTTRSLPIGQTVHADDPSRVQLHVMCSAVSALRLWFPRCACGWIGPGQDTYQQALSIECGIERAHLDGLTNQLHLERAQREEAALNREFPVLTTQV